MSKILSKIIIRPTLKESLRNVMNFSKRSFKEKVFAVVKKIPRGKFLSYKKVAKLAGKPKAFRAVGNILSKNFDVNIPCYRVIRSDGKLGGYNRGIEKKLRLLNKEKAI